MYMNRNLVKQMVGEKPAKGARLFSVPGENPAVVIIGDNNQKLVLTPQMALAISNNIREIAYMTEPSLEVANAH